MSLDNSCQRSETYLSDATCIVMSRGGITHYYPRRLCRSARVRFLSSSVCCRSITQERMIPKCREWPWDTLEVVLFWGSEVKGQGHRASKFILRTRTLQLHTRTVIHWHSLGGVTSRLRFCGCLVRTSLTFARWHNQLSAWVQNRDRVPSS